MPPADCRRRDTATSRPGKTTTCRRVDFEAAEIRIACAFGQTTYATQTLSLKGRARLARWTVRNRLLERRANNGHKKSPELMLGAFY